MRLQHLLNLVWKTLHRSQNILNWVSNFLHEKYIDFGFFEHIKKVEGQNCDFGRNKIIIMFLSLSWCRRKSFFECWSIKIYPKSHRYLVFAVKSGTKLLCYAAAVRRQFFGKWLHLNMRRAGSTGPSSKRWGMKTIAKFPRCVFDILPHKAELLGAAHIDCRITNFVLKSPQPMSKKMEKNVSSITAS